MSKQEEPPEQQVVLLFLVMRRLEELEARLGRIEIAVSGRPAANENTTRPAANENLSRPSANAEAERTPKLFTEFIKTEEKAAEILRQLHDWIDRTERVKALIYLKAAIEARVLSRPPFEVASTEFPGRLGSKSLYYVYTGEPLAFTAEDLETLTEAKELLSRL